MANYAIAKGGNKRNFPWDNLKASANTAGDIKYEAALTRRNFHLPLHFDGGYPEWQSWASMELPTGKMLPNDTLDVFWINAGTEVHKTVINVKGTKAGVTGEFRLFTNTGVAVGAPIPVDFGVAGYVGLGGPALNTAMLLNGSLRFKLLTGNIMDVCFDVVTDLTAYNLPDACSCAPIVCDVPSPEPVCFSSTY